ncbi:hypothetical protein O9K51_09636 [Purpureocillium lavendulum]|uniref:Uncharacterized protein n=1 Tax=Purpureocillium lavendulum TaxID=1247861 RepID=A0AB34FFJ6_9HYPO|nr:hypothetical protein O9K51_09636 [Purpureocillium lavendulum]
MGVFLGYVSEETGPSGPSRVNAHLNAGSLPKKATKTMKERDRTKTTAHLNGVMPGHCLASRARPPASERTARMSGRLSAGTAG